MADTFPLVIPGRSGALPGPERENAVAVLRGRLAGPANLLHPPGGRASAAPAPVSGGYRARGKRVLDVSLVLASLPVVLPLVGIAALALWVEGGKPFYRQDRLGLGGARFSIVKLRTMVRDADARLAELLARDPEKRREWEVSQKLRHDPRVTLVGNFLRRTSMDELPQLWNVLKGEMSLVGPRPMLPEQLPLYGDPRSYFALRPGLTGLWQIGRRNQSSFAERTEYDAAYEARLSLWRDLAVMFKTVGVVLRRTGC